MPKSLLIIDPVAFIAATQQHSEIETISAELARKLLQFAKEQLFPEDYVEMVQMIISDAKDPETKCILFEIYETSDSEGPITSIKSFSLKEGDPLDKLTIH